MEILVKLPKMMFLWRIQGAALTLMKENSLINIRVRGFPLRDILSLRALGDGLGQGARVLWTPPPAIS